MKYLGGYPRPLPNDYEPNSIALPETTIDSKGMYNHFICSIAKNCTLQWCHALFKTFESGGFP